ncbi:hypothetical protein C9374_003036 [Naegleria lovaniensis]|uniref:Magnesium transporter n=1 Tax=Naegleria lovaniensis TaxID=51637 RepID=A0AA88KPZ3_NAELO|nr:uncharacterized protein C9374_003036 [Naegleria lovaniensis]KAG2385887.1 hypothetical protein C9374_003036 [Naegleria lovaniensis]
MKTSSHRLSYLNLPKTSGSVGQATTLPTTVTLALRTLGMTSKTSTASIFLKSSHTSVMAFSESKRMCSARYGYSRENIFSSSTVCNTTLPSTRTENLCKNSNQNLIFLENTQHESIKRNFRRHTAFGNKTEDKSKGRWDSTMDTIDPGIKTVAKENAPSFAPVSLNSTSISHKWNVVEFDDQGNVRMSQIKRSELYTKYGLQGRDIRTLVSNMNFPTILARANCIIVSISNISAIITHERLYLLKSDYSNNLDPTFIRFVQQFLIYYAKSKEVNKYSFDETPYGFFEQSYALPFEFRVLECILHKVCATIEKDRNDVQERVSQILAAPDYTSEEVLYQILQCKQKLTRFKTFVTELHETIENILDADDDMARMYLTEKIVFQKPREVAQHEEIEMLLETYQNRVENVINSIDDMREDLDDTQEFLEVCLDSIRNRMMEMELKLAIGAFALTFGTLLVGAFGMNLMSHLEDHPFAFYYTSGMVALATISLFVITFLLCKRRGIFKSTYVTEKRKELRQVITSKLGNNCGDM